MLSAYLSDLFPYPKYARKLKLVEIGGANCDMMLITCSCAGLHIILVIYAYASRYLTDLAHFSSFTKPGKPHPWSQLGEVSTNSLTRRQQMYSHGLKRVLD
jgi:hypothetical protein